LCDAVFVDEVNRFIY